MSDQVFFEMRPNGATIEITLSGDGVAPPAAPFSRNPPPVQAADLEVFRTGDANPADIAKLETAISDWLLGHDLRPLLQNWIGQQKLRFVFTFDSRLQDNLNDLPLELARVSAAADPILINANVAGFVYRVANTAAPISASTRDWPMRILLVRSNPADLGGQVPPGAPIRDRILQLAQKFGPNNVQVDLLSSEPGALLPPTWDNFKRTARSEYDLLIYLGHGDLQKVHQDLPPVAQLQFENSDSLYHEPVPSKRLATFLADNPIPAVILAGCLTAAAPGVAVSPATLATWMRGNQGMAQALVNSASGVSFAVGMRCKIGDDDATDFIKAFFENLFSIEVGNLEMAVRAARRELYGKKSDSSCWAAPVVFSSLPREPVFAYLTNPTFQMTPELTRELDLRREFLKLVAAIPVTQRPAALTNVLTANRMAVEIEVLKQGAMLTPELADGVGGQKVTVPVTLRGPLVCKLLQAKIATDPELRVMAVRAKPAFTGGAFRLMSDLADPGVFEMHLKEPQKSATALPEGEILEFDLMVSQNAGRVCAMNLELLATDAVDRFWPGANAVIVPPLI